jgi:hypothetical protein
MPIVARSSARPVRRAVPGQSIAKRRESIAAFEQWQRNWSTSVPEVEAAVPPSRAVMKRSESARSAAHPR